MSLTKAIQNRVPPDIRDLQAAAPRRAAPPPGFPSHAFGPQPKPKINKPVWAMTEAELLAVARGQAEAEYQPQLDALSKSRREQEDSFRTAQAGLAALTQALQAGTTGYAEKIAQIFKDAQNAVNSYSEGGGSNADVYNKMYEAEGAAYQGADKPYAALIGQQGRQDYLASVQDQNAAAAKYADAEAALRAKIPGAVQDALGDLYKARSDYEKANKPVLKTIGGSLYAVNPNDPTQMVLLKKAPDKPLKVNMPLSKALGMWVDASGRPIKGITAPVPQPDPTQPKIALDLSRQLGYWADSSGVPIPGIPGSPAKKPGPKKTVSASVIAAGFKTIREARGLYLSTGPGARPLDLTQVRKIVADFNKKMIARGATTTLNGKTVPFKDNPVTVEELPNLDPALLAEIGLTPNENWKQPQQVYLELVESGIPARKAWEMVRRYHPTWGKGYFGPKSSATAETVAYHGTPLIATHGTQTPRRIILHTTENDSAPESTVAFWRDQGKGYGAQFVIGSDGRVLQTADPTMIAYHAGGENTGSVGIEIAGQARYTRAQWLARPKQLQAIAETIAKISAAYNIPITFAENGVWTHAEVSKTHGASEGHWDPGPGFPMQKVLQMANQYKKTMMAGDQTGVQTIAYESGSPQAARQAAFALARNKYKWGEADISALDHLWESESGWDYTQKNSSSGALGIPQALGHELPADFASNPATQIRWGLDYIKGRYRTPSRAWAFWQATVNGNANLAPSDLRKMARYWISQGYKGY